MDDVTEISEDQLPKRQLRGSRNNFNGAYTEKSPRIIGWSKLKNERWSCSRSERNKGIHHVLKKCIKHGTTEAEICKILSEIRNELAIEAEDS